MVEIADLGARPDHKALHIARGKSATCQISAFTRKPNEISIIAGFAFRHRATSTVERVYLGEGGFQQNALCFVAVGIEANVDAPMLPT